MRLLPLLVLLAACARPDAPTVDPEDRRLPYDLASPDLVISLPAVLQEVSGLTVVPSGRLGMVQDEAGVVFEVDPATGAVVDRLAFAADGDFEGLALGPDALWALRSDGDLFRVWRDEGGQPRSRRVETALKSRNDTEGLAYDAAQNRLLVACKEWPGPDLDDVRAVYAFDLATETVSEAPVILLDRAALDAGARFKPSALAVHPATGELYVLSSVRRALAVIGTDGALVSVTDLPARYAPQPEGLAFAPDGTLFVASEGPTGPGTLLRYAPTR